MLYSKGKQAVDTEAANMNEDVFDDALDATELSAPENVARKRTWTEKCCPDVQVKERTRRETIVYWVFRVSLTFLFVLYVLLIVMKIGSRVENGNAQNAPDTTPFFVLDPVCGLNPVDKSFMSFPNKKKNVKMPDIF
jgi:hypothetical protein